MKILERNIGSPEEGKALYTKAEVEGFELYAGVGKNDRYGHDGVNLIGSKTRPDLFYSYEGKLYAKTSHFVEPVPVVEENSVESMSTEVVDTNVDVETETEGEETLVVDNLADEHISEITESKKICEICQYSIENILNALRLAEKRYEASENVASENEKIFKEYDEEIESLTGKVAKLTMDLQESLAKNEHYEIIISNNNRAESERLAKFREDVINAVMQVGFNNEQT